jgi:hypothetical protein
MRRPVYLLGLPVTGTFVVTVAPGLSIHSPSPSMTNGPGG